MSLAVPHEASRYSRTTRQFYRQTIWPTAYSNDTDFELSAPWPGRYGSFRKQNKRWTGAFDNEARASRMSFMVGNTLLPPQQKHSEHRRWTGQPANRRATWLNQFSQEDVHERVWSGEFDVERRPSWVSRNPDQWSDDLEIEKIKRKSTLREEQLSHVDKSLITREVLQHQYEGSGTEDDPYLVTWIENDVGNPLNFGKGKKWANAMMLAFACFMVSIASSGFSQGMLFGY